MRSHPNLSPQQVWERKESAIKTTAPPVAAVVASDVEERLCPPPASVGAKRICDKKTPRHQSAAVVASDVEGRLLQANKSALCTHVRQKARIHWPHQSSSVKSPGRASASKAPFCTLSLCWIKPKNLCSLPRAFLPVELGMQMHK